MSVRLGLYEEQGSSTKLTLPREPAKTLAHWLLHAGICACMHACACCCLRTSDRPGVERLQLQTLAGS